MTGTSPNEPARFGLINVYFYDAILYEPRGLPSSHLRLSR